MSVGAVFDLVPLRELPRLRLQAGLEAAVLDGRVKRNVAQGVRLPPESTRPMRFLDPDQVAAVAAAIRPTFYAPLVLTAAYAGLRWAELPDCGSTASICCGTQ